VRPSPVDPESGSTVGDVVIVINGSPLLELVRGHERAEASRSGELGPVGSYLPLSFRHAPRRLLYAQPVSEYERNDGRFILMGCVCGTIDCWPLVAGIRVSDSEVVWSDFQQPFRSWDYSTFGPFRFGRHAYDDAIEELDQRLRRETRAPAGWASTLHGRAVQEAEELLRVYRLRLLTLRRLDDLPVKEMREERRGGRGMREQMVAAIEQRLGVDARTAHGIAVQNPDALIAEGSERQERMIDQLTVLLDDLRTGGAVSDTQADVWYDDFRHRLLQVRHGDPPAGFGL
jgi:hypothetical protein